MNFKITDICENIFDLNFEYGRVSGVFNNCFNIITEESKMLTIFKKTQKFSTRALISNMENINGIFDDMKVINKDKKIFIDDFCFDYKNARKIKTKREILNISENIGENFLIFEDIIKPHLEKSPLFLEGIIKKKADEGFKKLYKNCKEGFKSLIGLGIGLTPSCDDVISGISAYFYLCGKNYDFNFHLKDYLEKYGDDSTTFVSKNLLCDTLNGYINDSVYNVIYSILNNKNDIKKYTLNLIDYGHSSGVETCLGILKGYKMTKNKELI